MTKEEFKKWAGECLYSFDREDTNDIDNLVDLINSENKRVQLATLKGIKEDIEFELSEIED